MVPTGLTPVALGLVDTVTIMKVLIISDSRGRRLQALIEGLNPAFTVRVLVHPGAGLELAVLRSVSTLGVFEPDVVLIFAGVCDLTWKNKQTKKIGLQHSTIQGNVDQLMGAVKSSYDLLQSMGKYRISYATVTGVDLMNYNLNPRARVNDRDDGLYCDSVAQHQDQDVLNDSILEINREIVRFNRTIGSRTTWMAGLVHTYVRGRYRHRYGRLVDGCHPTDMTAQAWAGQIVKSVARLMPDRNTK